MVKHDLFKIVRQGYDCAEVNQALSDLREDRQLILRQVQLCKEQIKALQEQRDIVKKRYNQLVGEIAVRERASDEVSRHAVREANLIIENAKTQRCSTCNTIETLLVHENAAEKLLPELSRVLHNDKVEIRADEKAFEIIKKNGIEVKKATEEDWETEYLELILSVKTVKNIEEAIQHIDRYSTQHSDAILTENLENAEKFINEIDSAAVYVNASTRFTDGGEFGYGGEIGISTQKLHSRGPMGIRELTTIKYIIRGNGQIRK